MKFKVGDEVLIKAEISDIHEGLERPYFVTANCYGVGWVSEKEIVSDKTYTDGLNDAWQLAKKIHHAPCDGGYSADEVRKIFGCCNGIMHKFTAEEALAKISEYEREKEIKVGDVVSSGFSKGVVARVEGENLFVVWSDGSCGEDGDPKTLLKTGKHIDIESLLRQIGE